MSLDLHRVTHCAHRSSLIVEQRNRHLHILRGKGSKNTFSNDSRHTRGLFTALPFLKKRTERVFVPSRAHPVHHASRFLHFLSAGHDPNSPFVRPNRQGFQFVYRDALCTIRTCKNIVDAKRRITEFTFKMDLRTTYTSATGQETNQECTYHHRK